MTAAVLVVGDALDRELAVGGAEPGDGGGSATRWPPEPAGGATSLVVALAEADVTAVEAGTTIRWLAGASGPVSRDGERVIAQAGEGLWRRAPWPVADRLFALAPPSRPHILVLGSRVARRQSVVSALADRGVSAEAAERLDAGRLEAASGLLWLGAAGEPVPAWVMAPLAARRVLILTGRRADFGLQPGVDHLAALDDDEAIALAAAVAAHPDALAGLRLFARRAAQHHRASTVLTRLLADVAGEDSRGRASAAPR